MTNDKELVEAWKKEFESLCEFNLNPAEPEYGDKGVYAQPWGNDMLKGFIMAKRTQPSVVLPKEIQSIVMPSVFNAEDIYAALTAAGIKYTIGE